MITSMFQALLSSWAIQIVTGISVRNFLLLPVFLLLWRLFYQLHSRKDRRPSLWLVLASLLLSLSFLLAQHGQYTTAFSSRAFQLGALLVVFIGLFLLFLAILTALDRFLLSDVSVNRFSYRMSQITPRKKSAAFRRFLDRHAGLLTFLLCVVFYLPYFLYEFPGILSPDGAWQAEQAIGVRPWSNHHPVAHSVVIWFFYHIGRLFTSDVNVALSFYTFAQLLFMAFCAAYAVRTLRKLGMADWVLALAAAFYALVPFNGVYAVMVGKDTAFSGITLLFLCSILQLVHGYAVTGRSGLSASTRGTQDEQSGETDNRYSLRPVTFPAWWTRGEVLFFIVTGILFCLFRTNGWYAFLLLIPFLLIGFRKYWKKIIPMLAVIVLAAGLIRGPVMNAAGVEKVDFMESICVPLQQVGRVAAVDQGWKGAAASGQASARTEAEAVSGQASATGAVSDTDTENAANPGHANITEEQRALINRVCHYEDIPKVYDPDFADMMKELIRTNGDQDYLAGHKAEFLKLWLDLGRQNPGLYLQAWIDITKGYWFPDYAYETATIDGVFSNQAGLSWQPLIGGALVVKVKEIFLKLGDFVPIYGLLWSSGTYSFFLLMTAALILSSRKGRRNILVLLPFLALLFTLFLAAPISSEFRYTYPIVWTFPLWIALPAYARRDSE